MLLRSLLVVSTCFVVVSLTGCPPSDPQPATTATTAALPISQAPSPCTDGDKKCDGSYSGKVAEGNTPPAGANIMVCKDGKWEQDSACDAAANLGCYAMEDPGSGDMMVSCLDATDTMGE